MLLRTTTATTLLALLAACQSTPAPALSPGAITTAAWMEGVDEAQLQLQSEAASLRQLLAARGMPSSSSTDLAASLSALADSVAQLDARLGASAVGNSPGSTSGTPINASAPTGTSDSTGALEALSQALLILEEEHALHCENIANVGTTGYKRRFLAKTTIVHGATGLRIPKPMGFRHEMTQGVLEHTGNHLDFAIEGEGYFEIQTTMGELFYTRDGSLQQRFNGRIATAEGYLLTDQVAVPPDCRALVVRGNGMTFGEDHEGNERQVGTIRLHTFANDDGLVAVAGSGFQPSDSSGQAQGRQPGVQGTGTIRQGYIERSNVNITDEMIGLQLVERQAAAVRRALASYGVLTSR